MSTSYSYFASLTYARLDAEYTRLRLLAWAEEEAGDPVAACNAAADAEHVYELMLMLEL